ncbi:MAG: glycosyltransferase family 4 protein [Acidobacteria bacterium]|nr:glycosyltransferase family 4 protein [Acidobacteriota bacterium]
MTPRPLRVLHVVHDYFPAIGGSELLFQHVGEGLAARGMHVSVFTSTAKRTSDFVGGDNDRFAAGQEEINGVYVRRFDYRRFSATTRLILTTASSAWTRRRWRGYGWLKAVWVGPHLPGLVREAVRLKPDLIAATAAPFMPIYRALEAGRRLGVPVAIMPCLHPGDEWLLDSPSLFTLLRRADAVLTLTPYENQLLQAIGLDPRRLHLLGGGVSPASPAAAEKGLRERFGIPLDAPLVLFCGRMEEGKGVLTVVEAMARLWQVGHSAGLVLAGAATQFSNASLARALAHLPGEWRRHIIVRNDITEGEKWGWYGECDVLAHPSRIESFGLVYLEAWVCGKPVIGGRTGPQASLITHGRDGLLVRPGDVEELVDALRLILSDRARAAAFGAEGRAKVMQHHTWDCVVDRAAAIYSALARARAGAATPSWSSEAIDPRSHAGL